MWEQSARRPPPGIPATTEGTVLSVDLILGSFTRTSSVIPLLTVKLPPSLPVAPHPEESLYHVKPPLHHTFKEEQRMPSKTISLAFVVIALSPWVILLSLVSAISAFTHPCSARKNEGLLTTRFFSKYVALASPSTHCTLILNSSIHRSPRRFRGSHHLVLGGPQNRPSPQLRCSPRPHHCRCWEKGSRIVINRTT